MKKIVFSILIVLCFGSVFAQKSKKSTPEVAQTESKEKEFDLIAHYRSIYTKAISYNDFAQATSALYELIEMQPESKGLKDTLSQIYFQRGAWPQVVLLTTEILENDPTNDGALELQAIANQSLGRVKESLENYEALHKRTNSPFHLYEIAALQYSMRRFGECELSIQKLLADPETKEKQITISLQDGRSQEVPIVAAVRNLQGVVQLDQGNKVEAKKAFEAALQIFPDFLLAKNNLLEVDK